MSGRGSVGHIGTDTVVFSPLGREGPACSLAQDVIDPGMQLVQVTGR